MQLICYTIGEEKLEKILPIGNLEGGRVPSVDWLFRTSAAHRAAKICWKLEGSRCPHESKPVFPRLWRSTNKPEKITILLNFLKIASSLNAFIRYQQM